MTQRFSRILFVFFTLSPAAFSVDPGHVHHPVPKEPLYVKAGWYGSLKTQLPPPPNKGSGQQKQDEAELFQFQKIRTAADCERAKTEIFVSLNNFFASPYGPLAARESELLSPFFEQIRNDGDYFIQKLKVDFPRQRPFLYLKKLNPCIAKEVTGAYPSGHAVLSKLYALVLTDFYPDRKDKLEVRAKQIANDRILSGMHHRSDIQAGQSLATLIHAELNKSEKYQAEFKKLQGQLKALN